MNHEEREEHEDRIKKLRELRVLRGDKGYIYYRRNLNVKKIFWIGFIGGAVVWLL